MLFKTVTKEEFEKFVGILLDDADRPIGILFCGRAFYHEEQQ